MSDFNVLAVDYTAETAPADFAKSLRETGFAVLKNHPITSEQIDAMYAGWSDWFNSEGKDDYLRDPETHAGYFPFRSENAKDSPAKDLKEFYHVYPKGRVPEALQEMTLGFHTDLVGLGSTLLGWIEDNTPDEIRTKFSEALSQMIAESEQNLLRILHYPAVEEIPEPGAIRAAAHEDINLITLLVAGSEPGLEAMDANGVYHAVPCDKGMIAINVGDMLQKATRGHYPSTTHRVVNPDEGNTKPRYSMPMFIHPRPDVALDEDYTAGSYLAERLKEIGLKG